MRSSLEKLTRFHQTFKNETSIYKENLRILKVQLQKKDEKISELQAHLDGEEKWNIIY